MIDAADALEADDKRIAELEAQLPKKGEIDANVRAAEWVMEMVAVNTNHFKPNDFGEYKAEVWGKVEVNNIFVIKSVFDREMQNAGFNAKSFLSWAKRKGILKTDKDRRTKNALIAGTVVPTVCICKDEMRDLLG